MLNGVTYRKIDDAGLHITVGDKEMLIPADTVVICAGQDPQRELQTGLLAAGCSVHLIGGADKAVELDAKHAIKQGTELALAMGAPEAAAPPSSGASAAGRMPDPIRASLNQWYAMVAEANPSELAGLLHPKAVFRSPMAHTPYPGARTVGLILSTVIKVFDDFKYHREMVSADGMSVVLEFSAKVNGKELKGVDLIAFDKDGKIVDFEVMVRPMSALQALGDEMGQRLAPYMAAMQAAKAD
jgi:2,4-dienoyl-CoA reductase (NADPH2)